MFPIPSHHYSLHSCHLLALYCTCVSTGHHCFTPSHFHAYTPSTWQIYHSQTKVAAPMLFSKQASAHYSLLSCSQRPPQTPVSFEPCPQTHFSRQPLPQTHYSLCFCCWINTQKCHNFWLCLFESESASCCLMPWHWRGSRRHCPEYLKFIFDL